MIFGEYSDIVENDILTMQRFLDVSRFLYSGACRYAIVLHSVLTSAVILNVFTKYAYR